MNNESFFAELIQTDQSYGFYVNYKSKDDFKIYFLDKEYCDTDEDYELVYG